MYSLKAVVSIALVSTLPKAQYSKFPHSRVYPAEKHKSSERSNIRDVGQRKRDHDGGADHDAAVGRGGERVEHAAVRIRWLRRGARSMLQCEGAFGYERAP